MAGLQAAEEPAGAIVTVATALQNDVSARPNYAAPIYGSTFGPMGELSKRIAAILPRHRARR
jgi:hypothetical protein